MSKKPKVLIALRTKRDITPWAVGRQLIDAQVAAHPLLAPEYVSNLPDICRQRLTDWALAEQVWSTQRRMATEDGAVRERQDNFAWKRRKRIAHLSFLSHAFVNLQGKLVPGAVTAYATPHPDVDWWTLFLQWCQICPPQLAVLHHFTLPELADHQAGAESFQAGSLGAWYAPHFQNAAWAMYFGEGMAQHVDAPALQAAGFLVDAMPDGYLVRITPDLADVARDYAAFAERRAELKQHFPPGFFPMGDVPELLP